MPCRPAPMSAPRPSFNFERHSEACSASTWFVFRTQYSAMSRMSSPQAFRLALLAVALCLTTTAASALTLATPEDNIFQISAGWKVMAALQAFDGHDALPSCDNATVNVSFGHGTACTCKWEPSCMPTALPASNVKHVSINSNAAANHLLCWCAELSVCQPLYNLQQRHEPTVKCNKR